MGKPNFNESRKEGVRLVSRDSSGLLQTWRENGYDMSVARDAAGNVSTVTASAPAGSYTMAVNRDSAGNYVGMSGDFLNTAMMSEIVVNGIPVTAKASPSSGELGKLRRGTSTAIGQGRGYIGADRLNDLLSWLIPTNIPVLDPNRFYGMTPLTSGVMTVSHNPASGEFPGSSLKIDMSGAGLAARYPNIPTTIDVGTAGNPVVSSEVGVRDQPTRAGGHIYMRIKVSDWSKVLSMTVDFLQGGGSTNKRRWAALRRAGSMAPPGAWRSRQRQRSRGTATR